MDGHEAFQFVFRLSYVCLRCIGAWPESAHSTLMAKIFAESLHFFCLATLVIFVNFMQTAQLIIHWGNLDMMTNVLSTADLPIANVTFMMIKFWRRRQVLRDLVATVRADWLRPKCPEETELMNASARTARLLAQICVSLGQGACLFYLVVHLYLRRSLGAEASRMLYLQAYVPYDCQRTPYYELTWICQCLSTFISTAGFIGFESFFVVVVMHVCGQLGYLRHRLHRLSELGEKGDRLGEEIASIVEQHNNLYRITTEIEEIFNAVNLVQLINFTIIFCLLGFRAVTMISDHDGTVLEAIFVVGFFTYLSSNLFICCYVAEQLRAESTAVEFATYDCCWYNMKAEQAKSLIFILMRTKKPFEVTAGNFFIFSLDTFSALMKTSASYMSVLIAMKNKDDE